MSDKAPATPKPTVPDEWRATRRVHGGLRQVWRGKDKFLHFRGQEDNEIVEMVVREHLLFMLRPALPLIGAILLFVFVSGMLFRFPEFRTALGLLEGLSAILIIVAAVYFIWREFIDWWVNITIITTKRILVCRGFINPSRKTIGLDKVVQVSVEQKTALSIFLAYGDVHIYLVGGSTVLAHVPDPKKIRDALQGVHEAFQATKKKKPAVPKPSDPDLAQVLEKLAKKEPVPKLPDADEKYAHRRHPARLRGPLRTFGGPLRIPCDVHYTSDEHTVLYVQRSRWLLAAKLILPVLGFLAALVFTFVSSAISSVLPLISVIAALILLVVIGLVIVNYVDDIFILTNRRIIDIERKFIFFYEVREEIEYKNIRDIKVEVKNIVQNYLDVGYVHLETPGNNPNIDMSFVDHPFFLQDKVNAIKGFKEKVDKAKSKNERIGELEEWFGNVVTTFERKMVTRGVPNLQKMDLWTASSMVRELGMKLVPVGESAAYPSIEPGKIVSQDPLPGTMMYVDPNKPAERPEIHVYLSKRA